MAVPSSGKAGSGDIWRGGWHRPLPCLCPRLCFTAPSILCLHGRFLPQYKITKEIEKLGGVLSPAQLLLPTMASRAVLLAQQRGERAAAAGRRWRAGTGRRVGKPSPSVSNALLQLPAGDAIWQYSKESETWLRMPWGRWGRHPQCPQLLAKRVHSTLGRASWLCQKRSQLKMHPNPCDLIQVFPAILLTASSHKKLQWPSQEAGTFSGKFCIALFSCHKIIFFPRKHGFPFRRRLAVRPGGVNSGNFPPPAPCAQKHFMGYGQQEKHSIAGGG